jgi:hypothetical protein
LKNAPGTAVVLEECSKCLPEIPKTPKPQNPVHKKL